MAKMVIHTSLAPEAVGPYSQAVSANGLVFCSGQVALEPGGGELLTGSVADETRGALTNLAAVLEAAGSSPANVVKVTAYLTDMGDFAEFNEAYADFFGGEPPARATVGVSALPKGARVEVECIALG
ncbi:MAG: reactive intermediate/imine deaminase [Actinobacteria bacterium]|nr:reactive intermediate/imine deaminase [Actinomycetota bacterium]